MLGRRERVQPGTPSRTTVQGGLCSVCVGLNYHDHAQESELPLPQAPLLFAKWPSALIPDVAAITLPAGAGHVDYEAELALVLGRGGREIAEEHALDHVLGYLCFNDVSAREIQSVDGQWTRRKSFDTFAPIGPLLVPAADLPDPHDLDIACRVNGETVQHSSTSNLICSIP